MDFPNLKNIKGMVIDGIFSSEAIDSSGEVVKIEGIDISSMESGMAVANYEHNKKDGGGFGREVVGRITYVHKIFKSSDCETEREKFFFKANKENPFLYGMVRLYDAAGHDSAKALAAQIRDAVYHNEKVIVRFSIEGSTLERDDNIVKSSVARKVALTVDPCNKTCSSGVIVDTEAPTGFEKEPDFKKSEIFADPTNRSIGGSVSHEYNPIVGDAYVHPLLKLVNDLKLLKSTAAEAGGGAPSSLSDGGALQRSDVAGLYKEKVVDAIKKYSESWDRAKFKGFLKSELEKANLPDVSDAFLDRFVGMAEDYQIKKNSDLNSRIGFRKKAFGRLLQLEETVVDLRKSLRTALDGQQIYTPVIYVVKMNAGGMDLVAGRFMIVDNTVFHLEDYYNLFSTFLPEGPLDPDNETGIQALGASGVFTIAEHDIPQAVSSHTPAIKQIIATRLQPPERPSVFNYWRPGMVDSHVIEFGESGGTLDGQALSLDELSLILQNVENGVGKMEWRKSEGLIKFESTPDLALLGIHDAVQSGTVDPAVQDAFVRHIFQDLLVKQIGNKYACNRFVSQKRPGVYAVLDVNSLDHISDTHGHDVGVSSAIALGKALRDASAKIGTVRVFRTGASRFVIYGPSQEDLQRFLREARSLVDAITPVKGLHKLSFAVGMGQDVESAIAAIGLANGQKTDQISGKSAYSPARVPNLAYSLIPGSEGVLAI